MTTARDQLRAAALLDLLETTERGKSFVASSDLGRRYTSALKFSRVYERRAIEWWFAANVNRCSDAMRAVDEWWPEDAETSTSTFLVLEGGKGTGKTTAAVALLLRRGGEFVRAGALQEIPLGDKGADELERLKWAPLLVIDNLGSEKDLGPTLERVHAIMVHRDGAKLPTVITTTLVPDYRFRDGRPRPGILAEKSFAGRYQDDVADRVHGDGVWVVVGEDSMRGQRPDLREAEVSAKRWRAIEDLVEVKRGGGDARAINWVIREAGFDAEEIQKAAEKMGRGMEEALATIPPELAESDLVRSIFTRYRERFGGPVAAADD